MSMIRWTPLSPGPPGPNISEPTRASGVLAVRLANASPIFGSFGAVQSTGTRNVAHCAVTFSAHGCQSRAGPGGLCTGARASPAPPPATFAARAGAVPITVPVRTIAMASVAATPDLASPFGHHRVDLVAPVRSMTGLSTISTSLYVC
ncbi:hypothetical protein [Streptomyces sp. NPDC003077]|uniref:hypothetical protein n=1 Tax=Streptomyces sp. NPDC003077 TaxID=3154443 RepID=UPI0033BCDB14